MLLLALFLLSSVVAEDKLVFVQSVWRHGDRIPKETYPTDPYQQDFWGMPWGEITQNGINHLFEQGQNLRSLYVSTGFLNGSYNSDEITIQSADADRCVMSGMAMMAGLYSDSPLSLSSVPSWPTGWYPVPIHTTPKKEDREMEIYCPAADAMQQTREQTPKFQDFLAANWNLFSLLHTKGGEDNVAITYQTIKDWATTVRVEREDFNLTLPDWITDDVYNQLLQAYWDGHDFLDGIAGFGLPQDDKLIKLKGGFLLHDWRSNLDNAKQGKGTVKYHGYSGHDHTVTALLHTLGAKQAVMGVDIAQYAATVICELWLKDGEYFVRFLYIDNCTSNARPITRLINVCPDDSDFCPFDQFYNDSDAFSTKKDSVSDQIQT
ncbi:hypothetical protein PRIPAC_78040 [Pristionchus pacificus]|uniref:Pho-14 n=1 Tax=Pristionchus pacificus TaxID=54126 RepID=A0A2A6CPE0_PRIPA|nr:hypothetical protein PRIPAC_78040 [Pristionchus pacificus]|eukprot:PDM79968.1 pho-14 [Pristionchus pacificus]